MTWGFPLTNPVPTEYYCGLVVNSHMNHRPVPSSLMPHQQRQTLVHIITDNTEWVMLYSVLGYKGSTEREFQGS